MKYRKKPIVIEARYFEGTAATGRDIVQWLDEYEQGYQYAASNTGHVSLQIRTMEGEMTVSPGDYVIRGVQGEFYPCKPDIFKQTYELVE